MIGLFERLAIGILLLSRRRRERLFEEGYPEMRRDTQDINLYTKDGKTFFVEIPDLGILAVDRETASELRPRQSNRSLEVRANMFSSDVYSDSIKNVVQEMVKKAREVGAV